MAMSLACRPLLCGLGAGPRARPLRLHPLSTRPRRGVSAFAADADAPLGAAADAADAVGSAAAEAAGAATSAAAGAAGAATSAAAAAAAEVLGPIPSPPPPPPTDDGGFLGWLADGFESTLEFLERGLAGIGVPYSYGFAIILLTLLVKAATFPLSQKSMQSSMAMQALQPRVKELQARYANEPEQLQLETARLYKEAGVNPLAGCLPTLATIPVFIGLYKALTKAADDGLLTAGFFWIPSLGGPTTLAMRQEGSGLSWLFPFVDGAPPIGWHDAGAYLLLPALLVVSQVVSQQVMTPKSDDPAAQQSQAILKLIPLMIGWFSLNVPSGLTLYWFVNNIISTGQQVYMKKTIKVELPPSVAAGGGAGGGAGPIIDVSSSPIIPAAARRGGGGGDGGGQVGPVVSADVVSPPPPAGGKGGKFAARKAREAAAKAGAGGGAGDAGDAGAAGPRKGGKFAARKAKEAAARAAAAAAAAGGGGEQQQREAAAGAPAAPAATAEGDKPRVPDAPPPKD